MSIYITLGINEDGEVFGLELNPDGSWRRNPLGYSTSCAVIRPVTKSNWEYYTENPESAKELWQAAVAADQTELGLDDWFKQYTDYDDVLDKSFVYDLLDDDDNPTVSKWLENRIADGDHSCETFQQYVEELIVESDATNINDPDEVYEWESSGWYPPSKPFVIELAPRELLDEYYDHLRKTMKEWGMHK